MEAKICLVIKVCVVLHVYHGERGSSQACEKQKNAVKFKVHFQTHLPTTAKF